MKLFLLVLLSVILLTVTAESFFEDSEGLEDGSGGGDVECIDKYRMCIRRRRYGYYRHRRYCYHNYRKCKAEERKEKRECLKQCEMARHHCRKSFPTVYCNFKNQFCRRYCYQ